MSEDLNIILNGEIVKGKAGETVLELANRLRIDIPTLCHDPRLKPYTSCYMCVVEIEGFRGLQPACSTRLNEGMKIETYNERIARARKTALELLLSNHYADCVGPCKETCPAGVDVQGYIAYIEKGMYHEAVALIKETNPLPAICGRVCVRPCEVACRRNLLSEGTGVGIDYLKRFASDIDLDSPDKWKPEIKKSSGKKVGIIGGGPAGLSAAFFLRKEGHEVDIYEASPAAGGWLRYGIPSYRLPNDIIDKEVENITELGVRIHYRKRLGDNLHFDKLKEKHDAFILAIGSQKGTLIGCEGDDAENVSPGTDFLKQMEVTGKKFDFSGKKVAVVGGGNTAMDCCRTAIRCGAGKVYVIYRRTEKEMPANPIEIHESRLEGVEYLLLTNPLRINKDKNNRVKSMTCLKMQLGEPDSSGRRRPVPIEGSEFDIDVDYVLAAIGQKTVINFLDEINKTNHNNGLKANRWGDIDADPETLQTGIPNIFAAGDGVTGPATLIQAIGQAKIAAHSCDLFLKELPVQPLKKEFLSKKDNFKEQAPEDYAGHYPKQMREEMPTIPAGKRKNFKEVELGYANESIAYHETQRCLECGCTEYFTCDLKKYSTEYDAEQKKYPGEFKSYQVDFRHPYIEFDNNKCILCARCIRICNEVVGANALGLVNRGFETFVAPSMGDALQDTTCESCGLCISTCPTGAITENVPFKPGPVKLEETKTICNYCSVGCSIILNHKNGFVMKVTGDAGTVNKSKNLCRFPKFGYKYVNDKSRIVKPLMKINGRFEEISFDQAYKIIHKRIKEVKPDENAFFAGARLTNEEQYLVQKIARAGARTNNIASFHYLHRGSGYHFDSQDNVPFEQISQASKIYLIGSEINADNAVVGFMINEAQQNFNIPVELVTQHRDSSMKHKANRYLDVQSYYHFIKAVNYYLVANEFHNQMFIDDNCCGFEEYKENLLKENFVDLLQKSGVAIMDKVIEFAKEINREMNAVIVFSEKELCANATAEIVNLALITGKLGKTANGLIALKEKNNSQGLIDMGVHPSLGPGGQSISDRKFRNKLRETWGIKTLPAAVPEEIYKRMEEGLFKNLFIFGEDPLGCSTNKVKVAGWLSVADFVVVQDYFMTETAANADILLPASLPFETGGTFTNTQKMILPVSREWNSKADKDNIEQLVDILQSFRINGAVSVEDVQAELFSLLSESTGTEKHKFISTSVPCNNRLFNYGCDIVNKKFEEEFNAAF